MCFVLISIGRLEFADGWHTSFMTHCGVPNLGYELCFRALKHLKIRLGGGVQSDSMTSGALEMASLRFSQGPSSHMQGVC